MNAKKPGQQAQEIRHLKKKLANLEQQLKAAHLSSPEGQVLEELREEKAGRLQLAENCRHYRERMGDLSDEVAVLQDKLEDQRIKHHLDLGRVQSQLEAAEHQRKAAEWQLDGARQSYEQLAENARTGILTVAGLLALAGAATLAVYLS